MTMAENIATLSSAFRQLSDALHLASVACKDLEYTLPLLAASKTNVASSTTTPTQQPNTPMEKGKRFRDPNEPKRPPTAYLLYQKEARQKLVEEDSQLKPPEIMGRIALLWNDLSESAKKPYEEEAERLKENYLRERDKYEEENPSAKKRRRRKDSTHPPNKLPSPAKSPEAGRTQMTEATISKTPTKEDKQRTRSPRSPKSERKDKEKDKTKEKAKEKDKESEKSKDKDRKRRRKSNAPTGN